MRWDSSRYARPSFICAEEPPAIQLEPTTSLSLPSCQSDGCWLGQHRLHTNERRKLAPVAMRIKVAEQVDVATLVDVPVIPQLSLLLGGCGTSGL
jgi:hypothetical protein